MHHPPLPMLSRDSTITKPCCESPTPFFPFPSSSPCPSRRYSFFDREWATITSDFSEYATVNRNPDEIVAIHVCLALLSQIGVGCQTHPERATTSSCDIQRPTPFFQLLMHLFFVEMARDAIVRFVCLHSSMPSFSLWEASVKFWPNRYLEQQQQVQHQTDAMSSIGPILTRS